MSPKQDSIEVQELSDGWFGKAEPSSSSDAATIAKKASPVPAPAPSSSGSMASIYAASSAAPVAAPSSAGGETPRASPRIAAAQTQAVSPSHTRAPRPPKISFPSASQSMAAHLAGRLSSSGTPRVRTPIAQTPLSENHTPPETPLKHDWQNGASSEIALTPRSEEVISGSLSSRQTRGGLLLDPGTGLLPQALQTPPVTRSLQLQLPEGLGITSTTRSSPLPASLPARPQASEAASRAAAPSPPPIKQGAAGTKSNIDDMLARLRQARSAGSGASMWAPKEDGTVAAKESNASASGSGAGAMLAPPPPARKAEKPARRSRESSEGSKSDKPAKSLFDRLGPAPTSQPSREEAHQLAPDSSPEVGSRPLPRNRRERRATSRTEIEEARTEKSLLDRFESALPAPVSDKPRRETRRKTKDAAAPVQQEGPVSPLETLVPKDVDESSIKADGETQAPTTPLIISDESAVADSSIVSEMHAEVGDDTTIGNETMSTINWADDDDDESLPDLPEDWTRQTPQPSSSPENGSSAMDMHSPRPDGPRRAARRGGRGRGVRQGGRAEPRAEGPRSPTSPRSQDRSRNAGKELFGAPTALPKMASDAAGLRIAGKASTAKASNGGSGKKEPRELLGTGHNGSHGGGKNGHTQTQASAHESGRRRAASGKSPKA